MYKILLISLFEKWKPFFFLNKDFFEVFLADEVKLVLFLCFVYVCFVDAVDVEVAVPVSKCAHRSPNGWFGAVSEEKESCPL